MRKTYVFKQLLNIRKCDACWKTYSLYVCRFYKKYYARCSYVVPIAGPWNVAIIADTTLALAYLITIAYEGAHEWRKNKNILEFTKENKHKEVLESDLQNLNGISKEIFLLAQKIHIFY